MNSQHRDGTLIERRWVWDFLFTDPRLIRIRGQRVMPVYEPDGWPSFPIQMLILAKPPAGQSHHDARYARLDWSHYSIPVEKFAVDFHLLHSEQSSGNPRSRIRRFLNGHPSVTDSGIPSSLVFVDHEISDDGLDFAALRWLAEECRQCRATLFITLSPECCGVPAPRIGNDNVWIPYINNDAKPCERWCEFRNEISASHVAAFFECLDYENQSASAVSSDTHEIGSSESHSIIMSIARYYQLRFDPREINVTYSWPQSRLLHPASDHQTQPMHTITALRDYAACFGLNLLSVHPFLETEAAPLAKQSSADIPPLGYAVECAARIPGAKGSSREIERRLWWRLYTWKLANACVGTRPAEDRDLASQVEHVNDLASCFLLPDQNCRDQAQLSKLRLRFPLRKASATKREEHDRPIGVTLELMLVCAFTGHTITATLDITLHNRG